MTMTEPTLEPDTPPDVPGPPSHMVWRSERRVIGGTAAGLAEGWGVDPAWVRLAFTALALRSGLGVFVYGAAWALLPDGPHAPPPPAARRIVAAALAGGALLSLDGRWIGGPWAVIVVLAGAATSLWRGPAARTARPVATPWSPPPAPGPAEPVAARPRRQRTVRPPSIVGRLALAVALAVIAVTALATDGRPGAMAVAFGVAAAVCGAGLVVASFGRRARYLVIPAVLALGGSGLAASIDGLGVRLGLTGDWRSYGSPALPARIDRRAGHVLLDLTEATAAESTVVRLGTGDVEVLLDPDRPVRVELRARVGLGSVDVIGQRRAAGYRPSVVTAIGPPDGTPVITIDAAVGYGSIDVRYTFRGEAGEVPFPPVTASPELPRLPNGVVTVDPDGIEVYEGGARRFPDGSMALPDGTQIEADNSRRYGPGVVVEPGGEAVLPDGTRIQSTGVVILPSGIVVSPTPESQRG